MEPHEKSDDFDAEDGEDGKPGEATDAKGRPLDERQQREVSGLKNRDREVRQHEQAHKAVGGSYAGAISYDYQQGPDGRRYAVGGEVSIDVSEEKDPAATAAKMRQVRAAALAPAEPSGQDLQVAAEASRIESEARQEMSGERMEKARGGDSGRTGEPGAAPGAGASDGEDGENAADSTPGIGMASANRTTGDSGIGSPPPTKLSSPYAGLGIPAGSRVGSIRSFSRRAIDVFA